MGTITMEGTNTGVTILITALMATLVFRERIPTLLTLLQLHRAFLPIWNVDLTVLDAQSFGSASGLFLLSSSVAHLYAASCARKAAIVADCPSLVMSTRTTSKRREK